MDYTLRVSVKDGKVTKIVGKRDNCDLEVELNKETTTSKGKKAKLTYLFLGALITIINNELTEPD